MENTSKVLKIQEVEKIIDSKETEDLIECINSLEIISSSIGEGNNAVIYATLGTPFDKVCLKKVKEKPQLICNDIEEEHRYQHMAKKAGVRTPLSLVSLKTDEGQYFIMERIDGCSVREAVNNPDFLPKKFDYKIFCDSLDNQVSQMHKSGLYHRDLHDDNVMIDKDGLPVIIDFGTATEGTGSESTYEDNVMKFDSGTGHYSSVNNHFNDDLESIKKIKKSLLKFLVASIA